MTSKILVSLVDSERTAFAGLEALRERALNADERHRAHLEAGIQKLEVAYDVRTGKLEDVFLLARPSGDAPQGQLAS